MVLSYNHDQFDVVQYIVSGLNVKTDRGGSQEFTCTITDYKLTTASSSVISPSGLTKESGCSALACTNYDVDTSSPTTIQFYTKVTFEGGSSIYTTNQVTIIVLDFCHSAVFVSTTIATTTQYTKTAFSSALFTTNPSPCAITYQISTVNHAINTPPGLNPSVDVTDLINFKINPVSASSLESIFYLKATITISGATIWSPLLTYYYGCGTWSTLDEPSSS